MEDCSDALYLHVCYDNTLVAERQAEGLSMLLQGKEQPADILRSILDALRQGTLCLGG